MDSLFNLWRIWRCYLRFAVWDDVLVSLVLCLVACSLLLSPLWFFGMLPGAQANSIPPARVPVGTGLGAQRTPRYIRSGRRIGPTS